MANSETTQEEPKIEFKRMAVLHQKLKFFLVTSKQYPTSSALTERETRSLGNKQKYRSLRLTSSFSTNTWPICTKLPNVEIG